MKPITFIFICFIALLLSSMLGCASLEGGKSPGVNWALDKKGGKVTAFSEVPGYSASTLIDGVTSSENWNNGDGWQASMGGGGGGRGGQMGGVQERNWVIVELPKPIVVSRVRIYTVDSKQYPAKDFGVSHLLVQYESETTLNESVWVTANRYGKGVGSRDNIVRNNVKDTIDVRFDPVKTKRIRVLIYGTNDMDASSRSRANQRGGMGGGRTTNVNPGVIRLTEIEVYGT